MTANDYQYVKLLPGQSSLITGATGAALRARFADTSGGTWMPNTFEEHAFLTEAYWERNALFDPTGARRAKGNVELSLVMGLHAYGNRFYPDTPLRQMHDRLRLDFCGDISGLSDADSNTRTTLQEQYPSLFPALVPSYYTGLEMDLGSPWTIELFRNMFDNLAARPCCVDPAWLKEEGDDFTWGYYDPFSTTNTYTGSNSGSGWTSRHISGPAKTFWGATPNLEVLQYADDSEGGSTDQWRMYSDLTELQFRVPLESTSTKWAILFECQTKDTVDSGTHVTYKWKILPGSTSALGLAYWENLVPGIYGKHSVSVIMRELHALCELGNLRTIV